MKKIFNFYKQIKNVKENLNEVCLRLKKRLKVKCERISGGNYPNKNNKKNVPPHLNLTLNRVGTKGRTQTKEHMLAFPRKAKKS